MRNLLIACLVLSTAGACRGKPKHQEPPPNAAAGPGSGSAKGPQAAPDLVLPSGPGTPPVKTTKPLGAADFEKLSKLTFPGFTPDVRTNSDKVLEVRQKTKDHPRLWATITIKPCFDCLPMQLDKWKAKEEELKTTWLGPLKAMPDTKWEMGEEKFLGQPLIYTYQLGQGRVPTGSGSAAAAEDKESGGAFSYSDAYILYFNDGVNEIRVVAEYKDDPVKTAEMMAKMAPKGDLAKLAVSFLDVYTHAWAQQ